MDERRLGRHKKLGTSCEDMEAYHERLRVRVVSTLSCLAVARILFVQAWKSLIVVSGSPYRIDTNTNTFADQVVLAKSFKLNNQSHLRFDITTLNPLSTSLRSS